MNNKRRPNMPANSIRLSHACVVLPLRPVNSLRRLQPRPSHPTAAAGSPRNVIPQRQSRSIDKSAGTANIDNEPIPGFMDPWSCPTPSSRRANRSTSARRLHHRRCRRRARQVLAGERQSHAIPKRHEQATAAMHIPAPGDKSLTSNSSIRTASASRCISIAARPCSSLSSTPLPFPISARASATSSPPSTTRSRRSARYGKTHLSASASTPPTTRPKFPRLRFFLRRNKDPALFTHWEFSPSRASYRTSPTTSRSLPGRRRIITLLAPPSSLQRQNLQVYHAQTGKHPISCKTSRAHAAS